LKPERWRSPLAQEKYQEEKACDKRHSYITTTTTTTTTTIISFMQDVYTYIPEKNYVPREYGVAAILLLLFMVLLLLVSVLNLLCFYISTF